MTQKVAKLEAEEKLPGAITEPMRMPESNIHRLDQVLAQQKEKIQEQVQVNEHHMAKIRMQDQIIAHQNEKIQMGDQIIAKQKKRFRAKIQMKDQLVAQQRAMFEAKMQVQDQVIAKLRETLMAQNLLHEKLISQIINCKVAELKVQVESENPDYEVIRLVVCDIKSAMDMISGSLRVNAEAQFSFQYEVLKHFNLARIDASQWARIETVVGSINTF